MKQGKIKGESSEVFQSPPRRVVHYCRVSTKGQDPERQVRDLAEVSKRFKERVVAVVVEKATSDKPHMLKQRKMVMEMARRGEIDAIRVTEITRWGGSAEDVVNTLKELAVHQVSLFTLDGFQLDLRTFDGEIIARVLAWVSEMRLQFIRNSIKSKLAQMKADGKQLGRPPGFAKHNARWLPLVEKYLGEGLNPREIRQKLNSEHGGNLSRDTVKRLVKHLVAQKSKQKVDESK